jgi:hypothetical protein
MLEIRCLVVALVMFAAIFDMNEMNAAPKPDINAVLRNHERELMSIPNVVGVYVGVIEPSNKPCLKVMVTHQWSKSDPPIPSSLEGYPVIIEVTGEIRPLRSR